MKLFVLNVNKIKVTNKLKKIKIKKKMFNKIILIKKSKIIINNKIFNRKIINNNKKIIKKFINKILNVFSIQKPS